MLVLNGLDVPMARTQDGWHHAETKATIGSSYAFALEDGRIVGDPASRQQAGPLDGPSILTDPDSYAWQKTGWTGRPWEETIVYEIHIGTFTEQGTFRAALERLQHLAQLGFTAIEIMPLAHFPGDRGWGYDGVLQFAPHSAYGSPDDFKALVDAAHGLGMMVFLDVVYNHFGPEGNYLGRYAPGFFRQGASTPWGDAIAYEKPEVRAYFIENVLYWLRDFRLDGLRFDAIDQIEDGSDVHILEQIARTVRNEIVGRHVHLITENPANGTDLMADQPGGRYFQADWNDDFHHSATVTLSGRHPAYYTDYRGTPQELISALKWGYLYQGQHYYWQKQRRGRAALDLDPKNFVTYLQNHDQIANSVTGERVDRATSAAELRAMTALMLLSPPTPMLFQGQEFGASTPFFYFADQMVGGISLGVGERGAVFFDVGTTARRRFLQRDFFEPTFFGKGFDDARAAAGFAREFGLFSGEAVFGDVHHAAGRRRQ